MGSLNLVYVTVRLKLRPSSGKNFGNRGVSQKTHRHAPRQPIVSPFTCGIAGNTYHVVRSRLSPLPKFETKYLLTSIRKLVEQTMPRSLVPVNGACAEDEVQCVQHTGDGSMIVVYHQRQEMTHVRMITCALRSATLTRGRRPFQYGETHEKFDVKLVFGIIPTTREWYGRQD